MDIWVVAFLASGMLVAAFLYSAVGHGGASAYIAAMALAGIAPAEMRPVALQLNVLVSAIATYKFWRAGYFRWPLFWPFAIVSIPAAYLGGAITLPGTAYKILVGVVLLYAGWQLWWSARLGDELRPTRPLRIPLAMAIGGVLGVLSGLTGVGGGIFLSPLLLLFGWAGTKQTSATSAPFILVNSIAGLAGFVTSGQPIPALSWTLAPAAVVAGTIGSRLGSRHLPVRAISFMLAAVLVIAGFKLIFTR
jgi:uncharacterized membrane protein YfcA